MADKKITLPNNPEKKLADTGAVRPLDRSGEKQPGFLESLNNNPLGQIVMVPLNLIALFIRGLKGFLGIKTAEKDPFLLIQLQKDRPFGLEPPAMQSTTNSVPPEAIREVTPGNQSNQPNLTPPTATALGDVIAELYKNPTAEKLFKESDKEKLFAEITNTNQQQQTIPKHHQRNQIG